MLKGIIQRRPPANFPYVGELKACSEVTVAHKTPLFRKHVHHVFLVRTSEKMLDPAAHRVIASMTDLGLCIDLPEVNLPHYSVGLLLFSIEVKDSVTIVGRLPGPQPALS